MQCKDRMRVGRCQHPWCILESAIRYVDMQHYIIKQTGRRDFGGVEPCVAAMGVLIDALCRICIEADNRQFR
jgi:hypothetical protein